MIQKITFSADERLISKARQRASEEGISLDDLFRRWIARYVGNGYHATTYRVLMQRLSHVSSGRRYTREEMNER